MLKLYTCTPGRLGNNQNGIRGNLIPSHLKKDYIERQPVMTFLSPFSHIIAKKLRLKGLHWTFLFSPPLLKGFHWTFLFPWTILKGLHWTFLFPSTILKGLHCTFLFSTKIQKGLHWTNVFFDPNAGRDENTLIRVSEGARPLPHILTIAKPWPQLSIE